MFIRCFTGGLFQVNCYLIGCEKTRRAALIDPGDSGQDLVEQLQRDSWQVESIYLTKIKDAVYGQALSEIDSLLLGIGRELQEE